MRNLVENDSCSAYITEKSTKTDPISKIIDKFRYHPSILSIRKNVKSMKFSFKHFSEEDIGTEIKRFDYKKSSTGIPIRFLKEHSDILSGKSKHILNNCLHQGIFPDRLKLADISPIFKADDSSLNKIIDQLVY